jgi:putative ubiquitin-RnfH superfamily antitoxin RatB of RatAB toxin-antitoxin module|tara:strand:+ start:4258 stop:4476 length:219 start_codon:yes stop_codon:yes gene_type:complete
MSEIFVKVGKVPGATTEVVLEQGATVAEALSAAGIEIGSTTEIKLNGAAVSQSDVLGDNSRLIVSDGAKGNG